MGPGVTLITFVQIFLHPSAVVVVTEYVPATLTEMVFVVAPLFHKYVDDVTTGTESCAVWPSQIVPGPSIVQTGTAETETVFVQTLELRLSFVMVSV